MDHTNKWLFFIYIQIGCTIPIIITIIEERIFDSHKNNFNLNYHTDCVFAVRISSFIHHPKWQVADNPNISNCEMRNLLTDYVRPKFLTASLLQNARKLSRDEIFGDPSQNVYYIKGLVNKMEEAGHDVHLVLKNNIEVLKMLE